MKKNLINIALGIFILSAASCTDEVMVNETNGLRVSAGITTESRTSFIDDGEWTHTHWVADDRIGLYSGSETNVSYKAVSGGSTTDFTQTSNSSIASEEGKKVRAYYPYSEKATGKTIPLPYTIATNSSKPAAAFLYSEATINKNSLNFQFKHLFSYLKITLNGQQFKDNLPEGCKLEGGLYIQSEEPISVYDATYNIETGAITHNNSTNTIIQYNLNNVNFNGNDNYTFLIPMLPQSGNKPIRVSMFYPIIDQDGYIRLKTIIDKQTPSEGFLAGNVYTVDLTGGAAGNVTEKQALTDLYNSTNGNQWSNSQNWLSDLPVSQWYGINDDYQNLDYVYTLDLGYNNLKGTLPESLAVLMNKAGRIDISMNGISGTIPDAVKEHYKWNNLGWLIVPQDTRKGDGLDLSESNLYMPSTSTISLIDGSSSTLKNIFSKNKLTQVICYQSPGTVNDVMKYFDADRVNQHLDYQTKGLGTVIFTSLEAGNGNTLASGIKEKYGNIEGLDWMYYTPAATFYYISTYVFDSNGQLVYIAPYSNIDDNTVVEEKYNAFLKSVLGQPAQHEEFSFDFYTSTDYSKDGEVFTIQKATAGKGIDLVFLGEGFVDKDMAAGGKYETRMNAAADKLFELEPYKSLRNRFNLYGVKVVSPTAEFVGGAKKRINEDNDIAFDYASKYNPNLSEDARMMVVVVYNTDSYVSRSYCTMYGSGDFVAYNMDVLDNTLIHEVGGHGIAKLSDEYVEPGYEAVSLPENEKETLDIYHAHEWGWFANVDYHNTKSTVHWAQLLNDSRYAKDGIGIYEGANTYGLGAYRSSENSMMRHNISWFNPASREIIYKAVMTLSEGSTWKYDYETFVAFDSKNIGIISQEARSASMKQSAKEIREIREKHRKPVFIKGSWRDAIRNSRSNNITVPLR